MEKTSKSQEGFSLIELMVTVFILAFVAVSFSVSYARANSRTKLNMAAHKLASDIRLIQGFALGLKEGTGGGEFDPWGIHLDSQGGNNNIYKIFSTNDDFVYDNSDSEFSTIELPEGVTVSSILSGNSGATADIVYEYPDPTIHITHGTEQEELTITLRETGGGTLAVKVNKYGLVDID